MLALHIHSLPKEKKKGYFPTHILRESINLIPIPQRENKRHKNHTIVSKCVDNAFDTILF